MAKEDLGGGMTDVEVRRVMEERTRYVFQGGPVPPGLQENAAAFRKEKSPNESWRSRIRRFFENYGF